MELSHGSCTCLPQESKGIGTLSGSKAETNDDAASTSRSKSIQPNKNENFMSIAEGQKDDVMSMLSSAFQDKITRNRSIRHSILKTIYLCGKTKYSLTRSHRREKQFHSSY